MNFTAVWERSETDTWKHLNLSPSLKLHLEHTPSSCLPASSSRTVTTSRTTADEEAEVYSWTDRKVNGTGVKGRRAGSKQKEVEKLRRLIIS